jgi:hypothetical protein
MLRVSFFIFLSSCVSLQGVRHQVVNENERSPTAVKEVVRIIDSTIKSTEPVKYVEFDLNQDVAALKQHIEILLQKSKDEKKLDLPKLKPQTFQDSLLFDATDKGYRAGLKSISDQISILLESQNEFDKKNAAYKIKVISMAIQNKYISPIKNKFEILMLPIYILRYTSNSRIDKSDMGLNSNIDPETSLLWTNTTQNIASENLYSFKFKKPNTEFCEYEKAKSGWGVHAGFHVSCGDESFKLKFGNEINSGPFNSRIYNLLGYEAPQINFIEALKVKYNRKMFTEYNSRKNTEYTLTLLNQKISSFENKKLSDLFGEIQEIVLNDGRHLDVAEFKKSILVSEVTGRDYLDSDFEPSFEKNIKYIVFKPATLTTKTDDFEIGPWRLDELDFSDKREFRGLLILTAWLSNYDIRMDNNRLVRKQDQKQNSDLRLSLIDVGTGLGDSSSALRRTSSDIDGMTWTVSQTYKDQTGESETKDRLQMMGYLAIEPNKTFDKVQLSDAQWMLRKMCQISPLQMTQALVASGLSSAAVQLAKSKLLNRRNQMIDDFEMKNELQSSCYVEVNKKMNYDPKIDGLVEVLNSQSEKIQAPDLNEFLQNGKLGHR